MGKQMFLGCILLQTIFPTHLYNKNLSKTGVTC